MLIMIIKSGFSVFPKDYGFVLKRFASKLPKEEVKLAEKNRLYTFGYAEHGGLGLKKPDSGSRYRRYYPKPVRHFFAEEKKVLDVACGFGFTAFSVDDETKLYGTGISTDEQIGKHKHSTIITPVPIDIGLDRDAKIISLSAGRAHLCVLTDKGAILLGNNSYGQCGTSSEMTPSGLNSTKNCIYELNDKKIDSVFCGQDHTLFLCGGSVFSCGWGSDGQTGLGDTKNTYEPELIDLSDEITKVAGNSDTVLALTCEGKLFGWGSNECLQLSEKTDIAQFNEPRELEHINSACGKIVDMAAGGSFCIALNDQGEVFVWGYGILGGGPRLEKTPFPFNIPKTLFGNNELDKCARPISVHCGLSHLLVINNRHHVYSWGKNRYGCLGIGHTRDQYFPYKLALTALAKKISCGLDHTMILGTSII